jgi:hypothetical protein
VRIYKSFQYSIDPQEIIWNVSVTEDAHGDEINNTEMSDENKSKESRNIRGTKEDI